MSNVNNVKPWFREDIARVLMSIYFASTSTNAIGLYNKEYRSGFASALSSVAIMIGVNPETFLSPDDINLLHQLMSRRGVDNEV